MPGDFYVNLKVKEAKQMDRDNRSELKDGSKYYKMIAADLKGVVNSEEEDKTR